MDEIEIQIFDEITNYKEKLGFFTIRQWIFIVLIAITVIPTYIFLPKILGDDITGYVILIEAASIGFVGFVPIHNLPAEKIIPFWFRHYFLFNKPLEYMTLAEFKELKEQKKNRKHNKVVNEEKASVQNTVAEPVKDIKPIANKQQDNTLEQEKKSIEAVTELDLTKKTKKQKLTKEEKALIKAKRKYGYLFKEETSVTVVDTEKEYEELSKNLPKVEPDAKGYIDPFVIKPTEGKNEASSMSDELNKRFNSLSDEEKEVFLKLFGK